MRSPAAHADDTITITLDLNIACTFNPAYQGYGWTADCTYAAASVDGPLWGTSPYGPGANVCGVPYAVVASAQDSLQLTVDCYGSVPSIEANGGTGRFAGYTAPPTPQPLFTVTGAGVPISNPVCGFRAPVAQCPWAQVGTGLVTLTLTKTSV